MIDIFGTVIYHAFVHLSRWHSQETLGKKTAREVHNLLPTNVFLVHSTTSVVIRWWQDKQLSPLTASHQPTWAVSSEHVTAKVPTWCQQQPPFFFFSSGWTNILEPSFVVAPVWRSLVVFSYALISSSTMPTKQSWIPEICCCCCFCTLKPKTVAINKLLLLLSSLTLNEPLLSTADESKYSSPIDSAYSRASTTVTTLSCDKSHLFARTQSTENDAKKLKFLHARKARR